MFCTGTLRATILKKRNELSLFLQMHHIDVICLSEIGEWWKLLPTPPIGWDIVSYDKRGRGIAVFVRKKINTTVLHLNMDIEAVGDDILINPVLLETKPSKLALIHIYVRPGTSNWKRHQFFDSLLSEVKNFDYLICGDLNDPSKTFSRYNQNPRSPIADLISDHYITIANDGSITYPRANSCLNISLTFLEWKHFLK